MILCLGIPMKVSYYCSGVSPYTLWNAYYTDGITMSIDTSQCNFSSTPLYFTSLAGTSYHYMVGGYTAIYSPTKNSFKIFATSWSAAFPYTVLLDYSDTRQWDVNWFGILE